MDLLITLGVSLVVGLVALIAGYLGKQFQVQRELETAREDAGRIVNKAESVAKEIVLQAKDEAVRIREEAEEQARRWRAELQKQEQRLQQRRESLDHRFDGLENRSRKLDAREKKLDEAQRAAEGLRQQQMAELERLSGLTKGEAREVLLEMVRQDARQDMARVIRSEEMVAREEAERRAREIIVTAIQRLASEQVSESVVSTVSLPNDEMKGRIIGRQGRNIRAIESQTGVDIIVDDTPEAVTLSCFDPIRREVARQVLEKLIMDGRIHPARIEKIVKKTKEEVEAMIREEGEKAAFETGVTGLHPEIIKLLGRLKFRTSFGQNVLSHSVETAHIASMLAAELGADVDAARAGALLHDLGKAVTHEVDGAHATIGADLARRYGVAPKIVNTIAAHHREEESSSLEAILVEAADAISGARPGARRETLEAYVKRIKSLENVANSFKGVQESYAIQAGREIRIIVKPDEVDDLASIQLSRDIAKKIEEGLEYPGQIKVTVIRETRAVDYAK